MTVGVEGISHSDYYSNESIYRRFGLRPDKASEGVIADVRESCMRQLVFETKQGETHPYTELLSMEVIHITHIERTNHGAYMQIISDTGKKFTCKYEDIKDNTINPLDIFVIREDIGEFKKGSIVVDSKDSDARVTLDDVVLHRKIYDDYGYANLIQLEGQSPGEYFEVPYFSISKIRDIHAGVVPKHNISIA